jgi:hypothetical protein
MPSSSSSETLLLSQPEDEAFSSPTNHALSDDVYDVENEIETQEQSQCSILSLPRHALFASQVADNYEDYNPTMIPVECRQEPARKDSQSSKDVCDPSEKWKIDMDPMTDLTYWKLVAANHRDKHDGSISVKPSFRHALASLIIARNERSERKTNEGLLWLPSILDGDLDLKKLRV